MISAFYTIVFPLLNPLGLGPEEKEVKGDVKRKTEKLFSVFSLIFFNAEERYNVFLVQYIVKIQVIGST